MRQPLILATIWHPTYAHAAYTMPDRPHPVDPEIVRGDAVLGGEAIYLAAALTALGHTSLGVVAPVFTSRRPGEALSATLASLRSSGPSALLRRSKEKPGSVQDAYAALGRAEIGSNHILPQGVRARDCENSTEALVATATEGTPRPQLVVVGPECGSSEVWTVMEETHIPVALAPAGYPGSPSGIRRVTCTYDGSQSAQRALRYATLLAAALDAEIRVSTTTPPPTEDEDTQTRECDAPADPVLEEGCSLVATWGDHDIIATTEPDWAMHNKESSAEARWLPEELLVFGHRPQGSDAIQWETACRRFSVPYVLVPASAEIPEFSSARP